MRLWTLALIAGALAGAMLAQGPFRAPGTKAVAVPGVVYALGSILAGNATATPVSSGCAVSGGLNGDLKCPSSVAAGDNSNPGAVDLTGTNGATVTIQVGASPATHQLVLPTTIPTAGQKLTVASVSGTTVTLSWQ